ncbi:MAG: multifunctional CCA addition/repair protein, partial [Gammaproteobacteria bacterium]
RKVARGYRGFEFHATPDVTLEQDLARRDLTINAIARDGDGKLIDPFGGVADLKAGILRHVGPAFAEDPVRILRVARFAARLGFAIAPETVQLMRQMVDNGEVDALVPERVWQELARGLMEARPSRMFVTLRECGAATRVLPEVDRLFGVPQPAAHHPEIDTGVHVMMVIDYAAAQGFSLEVRFAALTHDLGKGVTPREQWPRHIGHEQKSVELVRQLCERIRVPGECRDLALLAARDHGNVHRALELRHTTLLDLLERTDALRRPQRFEQLLQACEADYRGRSGFEKRAYPQAERLRAALAAIAAVDAGAIAHACDESAKIPVKIREARLAAIRAALPANTYNKES